MLYYILHPSAMEDEGDEIDETGTDLPDGMQKLVRFVLKLKINIISNLQMTAFSLLPGFLCVASPPLNHLPNFVDQLFAGSRYNR